MAERLTKTEERGKEGLLQDEVHKTAIDEIKCLLNQLDGRKLSIVCRFIKTLLR